jgi:hypothetical protein
MARSVGVYLFALFACFILCADARTIAEKFDGWFQYVNTSLFNITGTGTWIKWNSEVPLGSISYRAAHYGALYGNMSVVFGQQTSNFSNPAATLQATSAYSGSYEIDLECGCVHHVPVISTTSSVPPGKPNTRWYYFHDYDNLLNLHVPNFADLWWKRINEFPRVNADVTVTPQGGSWIENGVQKRTYQISIKNTGTAAITSLSVYVDGGNIHSSWGLTRVYDTNEYQVSLYGGLAAGATVQQGFIASGTISAYLAHGEVAN